MKSNLKNHWETVFLKKKFNEVSWYQKNPKTSVNLILSVKPEKNSNIIDVGAGDSNFVDKLIELKFKNISVLDISSKALQKSKKRLGRNAKNIKWICSDIKDFKTTKKFDIWHDRALFHFLTSKKDIEKYVKLIGKLLKPNGYLIIATFSLKGPEKCSGINIKQYSKNSMKKRFGEKFKLIKSLEEVHKTPFKTHQSFIYNVFRKI